MSGEVRAEARAIPSPVESFEPPQRPDRPGRIEVGGTHEHPAELVSIELLLARVRAFQKLNAHLSDPWGHCPSGWRRERRCR